MVVVFCCIFFIFVLKKIVSGNIKKNVKKIGCSLSTCLFFFGDLDPKKNCEATLDRRFNPPEKMVVGLFPINWEQPLFSDFLVLIFKKNWKLVFLNGGYYDTPHWVLCAL